MGRGGILQRVMEVLEDLVAAEGRAMIANMELVVREQQAKATMEVTVPVSAVQMRRVAAVESQQLEPLQLRRTAGWEVSELRAQLPVLRSRAPAEAVVGGKQQEVLAVLVAAELVAVEVEVLVRPPRLIQAAEVVAAVLIMVLGLLAAPES